MRQFPQDAFTQYYFEKARMRDSERSITQNTYGVAVVLSSLLCTYTQQYDDFVQTDSLEQCTYAAVQQILFKRSQEQTCCFTF